MLVEKFNALTKSDIEAMNWYYQIELKPGAFTNARVRGTSSMVREVVRHINLNDANCLDIGSQECLLSAMMVKQGSQKVVAYDRLNLTDRINLVKAAYDVDFEYIHSLQLSELSSTAKSLGHEPFDVVVFAGVLYHMIDPLAGLAEARSLLREGGVMVLETSVLATDEFIAAINAEGRLYPGSNYFQISLGTLDYFMRMLRLKPIDLIFTKPSDKNICRVTIVARAVGTSVGKKGDEWIKKPWITSDFEAVGLDYNVLGSSKQEISYQPINNALKFYESTDIVDVYNTFKNSRPFDIKPSDGKLSLDDKS